MRPAVLGGSGPDARLARIAVAANGAIGLALGTALGIVARLATGAAVPQRSVVERVDSMNALWSSLLDTWVGIVVGFALAAAGMLLWRTWTRRRGLSDKATFAGEIVWSACVVIAAAPWLAG